MCKQSSQRMTWPPRATVRQLSIADITFNWPKFYRKLDGGAARIAAILGERGVVVR